MSSAGESRASKRRRKDRERSFGRSSTPGGAEGDSPYGQLEQQDIAGAIRSETSMDASHAKSLKQILSAEDDYVQTAVDLMQHLVFPTELRSFYSTWWKKAPFLASRGDELYFRGLPAKKTIEKCTQEHALVLDRDVLIRKGEAALEADIGEVVPAKQIWKSFAEGYVVELLHPQKYFDKLWQYISLLEIEFKATIIPSIVVAPSGAQCFAEDVLAEHADTVVLQLAGSATWTLEPVHEPSARGGAGGGGSRRVQERTQCGDTLYIPPEWRISCTATVGEEAVFCVMRTNHNRSLLNLSEMVATQSVLKMVSEKRALNEPLPRDVFSFLGVAHSEQDEDPRRLALTAAARRLLSHLVSDAVDLLDAAADQMAKDFVSSRAPIPLSAEEDRLSYSGAGRDIRLFPYSKLRMIRPGIAIAVVEDGHVIVYHCMENSR